jgi:Uncharacterized conserved protein
MNETVSEAAGFNPPPRDARLAGWLKDYPESLFSESLYQSIELMERYSIGLAAELLRQLEVTDQLKTWRSVDELCRALSFQPRFRSALAWLLKRLVEIGNIEKRDTSDGRSYRLHRLSQPELARLRAIGLEIDQANAPTLDLLDRAAALYPAVARGEQSAEKALFGPEGMSLWLNYFHNRNLTYSVNNWVGAIVAANRVAGGAKLRILEVGAGACSGSEILLQCLKERGLLPRLARYRITDTNAFFQRHGQRQLLRQYRDLPLEWAALDIDSPWQTQGVGAGEFDLVYGVNVLHVAKDLRFSLAQAHEALAAGSWLVIGECVRPYPDQPIYVELIFQILESFSAVNTDAEIRPNAGFLTPDQWTRALRSAGFEEVEVLPDVEHIREIYPHFFAGAIAGRANGTANEH